MALVVIRSGVKFSDGTNKMPRWAEDRLKTYLDAAGVDSILVSSAYRSPEDQARIMSENVVAHGMSSQRALYGATGNQVLDAYPNQTNMAAVIRRIGPERISRHMATDAITFDLAPSSLPGGVGGAAYDRLLDVLRNAPQNNRWRNDTGTIYEIGELFWPPKDPAIHVEFPGNSMGVVAQGNTSGLGIGDVVAGALAMFVGFKVYKTFMEK